MKTALLALGLYPSSGGPSKSVRAFADALDASVISWVDPVHLGRERLIWDESLVVYGSRWPLLRQLLVPETADLAAAERLVAESDLVSCHSFWRWHCIWLQQMARKHGVPYWFVPHGILDPYVFTTDRIAKRMFMAMGGRRFLEDAAAVVCATRREYEKLAKFFPNKPHIVVPWPLHERDFRERSEAARTETREALGIASDSFCLLYFGRLDPMKRPLETIDAVARAREPVHLVMVGNEFGVSVAECRRRAQAHGIADRVHVVGPAYGDDRHRFLDACDAYISLSHRENFNFTAAECLASGLPVILSEGNDLAWDLADAACGWMLREGDSPEAAIDSAARTDPRTLRSLGRAGRLWCERHLRHDVFRDRVRAFAATVVGSRSSPP